MKTTTKHFQIFQKEVHRLFELYELNNWCLRFEHKDMGTIEASSAPSLNDYSITIALNKEISWGKFAEEITIEEYIKGCAKHEVTHCLLARLSGLAYSRFTSKDEVYSAEEELVVKLMRIINK